MTSGIRAEVRLPAVESCPVARLSAERGTRSSSVSKTVPLDDPSRMTEEFLMAGGTDPIEDDQGTCFEPVFDYGDRTVYRFERERGDGCPCERIEGHGIPIVESHTDDGDLFLAFHADDMDALRGVISDLREAYPRIEIQRLLTSRADADMRDLVFVDRSALTERQREVLRTAHEMGYFDHPKGANATEVAEALAISRSTFSEHLAAAQRKLLDAVLA